MLPYIWFIMPILETGNKYKQERRTQQPPFTFSTKTTYKSLSILKKGETSFNAASQVVYVNNVLFTTVEGHRLTGEGYDAQRWTEGT